MEALHPGVIRPGELLIESLHLLNSMLTDLLIEVSARGIHLRIKLILLPEHAADEEDDLFLDRIRVLSHLESCGHELVLGELHAEALAELDGIGDVSHGLLLSAARSEN